MVKKMTTIEYRSIKYSVWNDPKSSCGFVVRDRCFCIFTMKNCYILWSAANQKVFCRQWISKSSDQAGKYDLRIVRLLNADNIIFQEPYRFRYSVIFRSKSLAKTKEKSGWNRRFDPSIFRRPFCSNLSINEPFGWLSTVFDARISIIFNFASSYINTDDYNSLHGSVRREKYSYECI